MAHCYCQILTPEQAMYDGTHKLSTSGSASTTRNCYVARLDSSSELVLCASGSKPYGLFLDHLDLIHQITVAADYDCININSYNSGKYTNVATGTFMALVGPDAFVEGSVPAQNATLYEGAGGKITVTPGTYAIGKCINAAVTVQHRAGSYSAAQCQFDFDFM